MFSNKHKKLFFMKKSRRRRRTPRYVNYVNDEITEMYADEEDSKIYKRNLKVNAKTFFSVLFA